MISNIVSIAIAVAAAILAITLHEAAHGYAAWALGDDTAKQQGRLSLNPLVHIDKVGTILLPGFLMVSQLITIHRVAFMFGWAKPVPVSAWRFPNPRRGMMIVAAAGPAMNFLLAWIAGLAVHGLDYLPDTLADPAFEFIDSFMLMNLVLALFNLLPLPPLDGGRIVVGLLPLALARRWAGIERYGIVIVLLLLFIIPEMSRDFGHPIDPLHDMLDELLPRARNLILRLSGNTLDE